MNPDNEIEFEMLGFIRVYKSGRAERLSGLNFAPVPTGLDPETGITSKDVIINPSTGVSARIYHPDMSQGTKLPVIVYCHGGAFVEGSAFDSFNHGFMNRLTSQANAIGVSVEYRLAPENPVPIPFDDSFDAFNWVLSHAKNGPEPELVLAQHADLNNVYMAGFSAGATIAHNIALRSHVPFKGLAILHPFFLSSQRLPSEPIDPTLRDGLERLWTYICCPNTSGPDDPLINPLSDTAPGLRELNCERVMVCLDDAELKVRGKAYCEQLVQCGWGENSNNMEVVESKQGHGFFFAKPDCEDAQEMMSRLVAFFKRV